MKRLVALCMCLSLIGAFAAGCEQKKSTSTTTTTKTPDGTTTTEDTHTVKSTGDNPPPNAQGETAK